MRRALALSAALLLSAAALRAQPAPAACQPQKVSKKIRLKLPDGALLRIDVVDDPRTREIGLMCRKSLPRDYGMLFVFPSESDFSFWMKNTLVSLDILWIGADKRITVIRDHMRRSLLETPDEEVARASGRGQYVLELPAGAAARHGLKAGDALDFQTRIPRF